MEIDFSVDDLNADNLFISSYVGYIGDIYYGNCNTDHMYSNEEIKIFAKEFLLEAQKKDTSFIVVYKAYIKSKLGMLKKEIIILEKESQEPMTKNKDTMADGSAMRIQILKNYAYGVFYYNGKLVSKISFI